MAKGAPRFQKRLVIFAKAPLLGTVKSRLAADIGYVAATGWYRTNCQRLIRRLSADTRWQTWLALSPDETATNKMWPNILPLAVPRLSQGRGTLGARMARVLNQIGPGPVLIVGSDIPTIQPRHVSDAFAALGEADMVLGPSSDGGYWLIGKKGGRAPYVSLEPVRWSSAEALDDTLAALDGCRIKLLETLEDVDRASDLKS